jgi:hypothetical protein
MTFEQPANLNRFLTEPVPLTWGTRWKSIRIFLPLIIFSTICFGENICLNLWTRGKLDITAFGLVLLLPVFLLTLILISNEFKMRCSKPSSRLLNVLEKGIGFQTTGRAAILWRRVVAFWFENIPGEIQFSKVTIEYFGNRNTKLPRRISMVLDKRTQCPQLISELQLLKQKFDLKCRIEQNQPLPPRIPPRHLMLGMSLYLAGMLFLLHGMPMLLAPLTHGSGETSLSDTSDRWSPAQREQFQKFLHAHFSSKAEFNKFMLVSGGTLTTIGVVLLILGKVVQRQKADTTSPRFTTEVNVIS